MSKQMSVRERFSLEFVTAKGEVAFSGAASKGGTKGALPDVVLFDAIEETPPSQPTETATAAFDAVEELKALFGAVKANR